MSINFEVICVLLYFQKRGKTNYIYLLVLLLLVVVVVVQ